MPSATASPIAAIVSDGKLCRFGRPSADVSVSLCVLASARLQTVLGKTGGAPLDVSCLDIVALVAQLIDPGCQTAAAEKPLGLKVC